MPKSESKRWAEECEGCCNTSIDPILLTQQLCAIESTTYHEGEVGDFLETYLTGNGWHVEKTPVPQPADGGQGSRWNIYASVGNDAPIVVFSTHMDTVPHYVPFRRDSEFLYGRGVCDAKGTMAAQIAAADRLRAEGFPIGMLFVSGEERDSAGAEQANLHPKGSRYLINGEPTDNRLAIASQLLRRDHCGRNCVRLVKWRTRRIPSWAIRLFTS